MNPFVTALIIVFIYKLFLKTNTTSNNISTDKYTRLYKRFSTSILGIINNYSLSVSLSMVLSVLYRETLHNFEDFSNAETFGDGGSAYGYMQITYPALSDVNRIYKLSYSMNDLKDEYTNLLVGTLYLEICYKSAIKQYSTNPVKLAFKKYNGGNDETDSSINNDASKYSDLAFDNYNKFSNTTFYT